MTLIFLNINTSLMFCHVYVPQKHLSGLGVFLSYPSSDSFFFMPSVSVSNSWQKKKDLVVSASSVS